MSEADVTATCDVIVVGGGGSGLAAALAAARAGRKVLVIEKAPQLGGTTALSVGTICATATSFQKAMRIVDAPDGQFEDMAKFAGPLVSRDNLALRRLLA
ncbi:MAG: FAD-dependent oxidoreductase, partial [Hyphomicrobiaceae bacterium]